MQHKHLLCSLLALSCAVSTAVHANNLAITGPGAAADGSSKASGISYTNIRDGNSQSAWQPTTPSNQRVSVKWSSAVQLNRVVLKELGSAVTSWRLVNNDNGAQLASGTTIGSNKIINFATISSKKLNLEVISASSAPRIAEFEVYLITEGAPEPVEPAPTPTPPPSAGVTSCSALPQGYASLDGGTTGGAGPNAVTVTASTGAQIQAALANRDLNRPLTIRVNGTITPANSGGVSKFDIKDMNNVSIIGVGNTALFDGIGIKVFRANNVILRNLKLRYVNTGDKDAITLEGPASNIWIDHNEIYNSLNVGKDFYDELISGKKDVDKVTISYNYLHDSWKTSLWGNNDSDNFNRRITFHHNYWQRVNSRLPLFRFGQGHIYNNYYTEVQDTGINSRMGAVIRIENNVFENTTNPIVSFYSSALGYWDTRGNEFSNTNWQAMPAEGVIAGPNVQPNAVLNLPYNFTLLPTNQVKAHVIANAGVNKCNF
ncbi:pectate lyase [Rheinheimera sediminis]|uniref:pectate lyase family protein n=1 Tax=Rheinheimera sp. YQF-1 TaxID=2499626 RepID=UPI000FD711F6|nr:pectate lyase [Rheinheimera sp. YQF-1]RVT47512.1 pectate lyase [Rheinheimera sp. YQF-1]